MPTFSFHRPATSLPRRRGRRRRRRRKVIQG
jgi:hypothetical protein